MKTNNPPHPTPLSSMDISDSSKKPQTSGSEEGIGSSIGANSQIYDAHFQHADILLQNPNISSFLTQSTRVACEFCQTVELLNQYALHNGKSNVLQLRNHSMCDLSYGGNHLSNSCYIFWPSTPLPTLFIGLKFMSSICSKVQGECRASGSSFNSFILWICTSAGKNAKGRAMGSQAKSVTRLEFHRLFTLSPQARNKYIHNRKVTEDSSKIIWCVSPWTTDRSFMTRKITSFFLPANVRCFRNGLFCWLFPLNEPYYNYEACDLELIPGSNLPGLWKNLISILAWAIVFSLLKIQLRVDKAP